MSGYGGGLFAQHQALLGASAIPPEVARERGYVSVDTKTRLAGLGFGPRQRRVPGLLIPVHDERGQVALHQYRPDDPRRTDAGRVVKYETPAKARMVVDVPPRVRGRLGDPAAPLWLTEGIRKADAATAAGLACLALLGVWNWRGANSEGGTTALAFWEAVALKERRVYVAFDSDVMLNRAVHVALVRLGAFLRRRGAQVAYVYLPAGEGGGKTGLDDFLAGGGTVEELVQRARGEPLEPPPPEPETPPDFAGTVPKPLPEVAPKTLPEVVATFRRWLHLPDPGALYAALATVAANRMRGDPVWLFLVGASSSGKTELVMPFASLPNAHLAATLSEPALLSGTSSRERAKDATGGPSAAENRPRELLAWL